MLGTLCLVKRKVLRILVAIIGQIVGARLDEVGIDADARIVHQDVDLAQRVERRLNRLTRGLFLAHIADRSRSASRLSHLAGKRLKPFATPGDNRYIRAFCGKRRATARPMPELAPVTTATFPSNLPILAASLVSGSDLVESLIDVVTHHRATTLAYFYPRAKTSNVFPALSRSSSVSSLMRQVATDSSVRRYVPSISMSGGGQATLVPIAMPNVQRTVANRHLAAIAIAGAFPARRADPEMSASRRHWTGRSLQRGAIEIRGQLSSSCSQDPRRP